MRARVGGEGRGIATCCSLGMGVCWIAFALADCTPELRLSFLGIRWLLRPMSFRIENCLDCVISCVGLAGDVCGQGFEFRNAFVKCLVVRRS